MMEDPDVSKPSSTPLYLNPVASTFAYINVYISRTRVYVIGCSEEPPGGNKAVFRILKIDRTVPERLDITDDGVNYNKRQIEDLLAMINAGSSDKGKVIEDRISAYGILGMVKFLQGYYMILITKRRKVGLIGKHHLYKIEDTSMVAVWDQRKVPLHPLESKYIRSFQNVDLSSNFYFSYTYDLTRPLQSNMHAPDADELAGTVTNKSHPVKPDLNFVWNSYLIEALIAKGHTPWALYVIHGFVTQSNLSVLGRALYITLIARRSRHYAGTRFLKRGSNAEGKVANHVETEQICHDASTLCHRSGLYTSFLQVRGSIPCYWSQDLSTKIKPPVIIDRRDPFASPAAHHFDDMLKKYGTPLIVLNLVKRKEKRPRESILAHEFQNTIEYLNQFVPEGYIQLINWDMHRTAKSKDGNVLRKLEEIARRVMLQTGFFHAGPEISSNNLRSATNDQVGGIPYGATRPGRNQSGILRVNCVDCLDRTNTAQFMQGLCALRHQLYALGVLEMPSQLQFDCDAFHLLAEIYEDHGDTIALQYGGSQLVNRIQTYRKSSQWTTRSRDILNTVARYYSNSFTDAEKQEAMNLFLGMYVPSRDGEVLYRLETDLFLHFPHIKSGSPEILPDYINWCDLEAIKTPLIHKFSERNEIQSSLELQLQTPEDKPQHQQQPQHQQTQSQTPSPPQQQQQQHRQQSEQQQQRQQSSTINEKTESRQRTTSSTNITHLLPSLDIFRCFDMNELKQKILEFYRINPDSITPKGLHVMHQPMSSKAAYQIKDLMNFFFGSTAMSLEQVANSISVSVLANAICEFSKASNYFIILNPAAARMDYLAVRKALVSSGNFTVKQFDTEVTNMVSEWQSETKPTADDCNVAALLIAGKHGFHFVPQTSLRVAKPSTKSLRHCSMYNEFYGVTRLTVFDKMFATNMDSSTRLSGQDVVSGSPFAVVVDVNGVEHENHLIKTAPTLDIGVEDVDSDEQEDLDETNISSVTMQRDLGYMTVAPELASERRDRRKRLFVEGETSANTDEGVFPMSAQAFYGIELSRPPTKELSVFSSFVDVGAFMEGQDKLLTENRNFEMNRTRGWSRSGGASSNDVYISTPASKDHLPVMKKLNLPKIIAPGDEAVERMVSPTPTCFGTLDAETLYTSYLEVMNPSCQLKPLTRGRESVSLQS